MTEAATRARRALVAACIRALRRDRETRTTIVERMIRPGGDREAWALLLEEAFARGFGAGYTEAVRPPDPKVQAEREKLAKDVQHIRREILKRDLYADFNPAAAVTITTEGP